MLKRIFILLSLLSPVAGFADMPVTFSSLVQQSTLLELYTSEGCSSCPPADRWLSTLKADPRLWKEIVPVAFHVDYWDYLGWKDKFSRAEFTQRQRNYARWNNLRTIYTPGVLKNGKEWRGWIRSKRIESPLSEDVGRLTVNIEKGVVTASFKSIRKITKPVILNVAWLGSDIETVVKAGENEGKKLRHDFVSFNIDAIKGLENNHTYTWRFDANLSGLSVKGGAVKRGAAFWITRGADPTPIQATGGWLDKKG